MCVGVLFLDCKMCMGLFMNGQMTVLIFLV